MLLNQPQSKLGQLAHKRWRRINRQANNWHAKAKRNFAHSLPYIKQLGKGSWTFTTLSRFWAPKQTQS